MSHIPPRSRPPTSEHTLPRPKLLTKAGRRTAESGANVLFFVDGKQLSSSEKNKGWLKPGKYPAKMSAPIDVGARVDGNTHEATIMVSWVR